MTTATQRLAALALLALAAPAALAQSLGDEFIFFVDGTNVLVPSIENGQTVDDPLAPGNTVMKFNAGAWTEGGFAWPRTQGVDATGMVGATFAESQTLYFRLLSDPANVGGNVSIMINDVTNDSGVSREAAQASPDDQDYLMRLVWPIPDEMHDGQWHEVSILLPPTTYAALEDAKANDPNLDPSAASWRYTGAWSNGGFGIGEVGGYAPPPSDPLWEEFQWDQMYRIGPFWDNSQGGAPIYLDDVYIGDENTSTAGANDAPTAMSGVSFGTDGELNMVSWSEISGVGGYKVYASLEPITDVMGEGVVELARLIGASSTMLTHRYERVHPELNPPVIYYAVTTLSEFGIENDDVSASAGSVVNDMYAQRPYVRGLTSAEANAIFDDLDNGRATNENFPSDQPMFVLDTDHRTVTEGASTPSDEDISATFMIGFSDQNEWMIYGEITDDVVNLLPEGTSGAESYLYDSIELAYGDYDVRLMDEPGNTLTGSNHTNMNRGDEPDYQNRITGRVNTNGDVVGSSTWIGWSLNTDFESATVAEKTDTGWKFLTVLPMDQVQTTGDVFKPFPSEDEIQLIPLTFSINDADATGQRESQVVYSVKRNVTNQWYQTPAMWEVVAVAGRNFMGTSMGDGARQDGFALAQSVPNPTSGRAEIAFTLGTTSRATLEVFNVLGQRVLTVAEGSFPAGPSAVSVDTNGLAAGIYVYRLTAGDFVATQRMTVVR